MGVEMPLDILIGAQWGDEGKGRITDLFAADADLVVRFSGGDNAGHTVTVEESTYKLHLIPSGILHEHVVCALGSDMVIHPGKLLHEIDMLAGAGVDVSPARLMLSTAAHIITPAHIALDTAMEQARQADQLGTTRRGIGPAYIDKSARSGIRAAEMSALPAFSERIRNAIRSANRTLTSVHQAEPLDPDQIAEEYAGFAERLRPYLADTGATIHQLLTDGRNVLAEGAQGTLLDIDHGTYPFVTSSHPTAAGALFGTGVGPKHVRRVIGVTKAFQTRVGAGPFPTELCGEIAEKLRGTGENPWDEFGTTTGRPRRCGWLDGVLLQYASRINGLTELALTKLDILSGLDPLKVCTSYTTTTGDPSPTSAQPGSLGEMQPSYTQLGGWTDELKEARYWGDLPPEAHAYVRKLEELTDLRVRWISVGPEREQIIYRDALDTTE
jgi:adenylosuccinate synthase